MSGKIEKLTKEQEARFPEFIKKWTDFGLSTEPADRVKAERGIIEAYKVANLDAPKIVWCGSPLSQGMTRAIVLDKKSASVWASVWASVRASVRDSVGASVWDSVWDSVGDSVRDSVRDSVGASVWDSVGASVRASVRDSVGASVWDSVWDSVGDSVRDSVRDSVGASVWDSVGASVWDSVRDSVRDSVGASVWDSVGASVWDSVRDSVRASVWASVGASVGASGYGQHDANWIGFYNFFRIAMALKEQTEKLNGLTAVTESAGWFLPHKKLCWISERHNILNRNGRGQLHGDGKPAVEYPDGWQIFALNGVRVKKCQAMTPGEQITPQEVLAETNADVRRELIRKVGVERMLAKLPNNRLDNRGDYEVLAVNLGAGAEDARYLRMLNPSIGAWHLEGIPAECNTVEKALNWRNEQWFENAEILT